MALLISDVPKDIYHSDRSSVDSLEPVGESGVETPYRNGWVEYIFISPQPRGRYDISPARARAIYYMSPRALARGGHIFV